MRLVSIHNFEIDVGSQKKFQTKWRDMVQWNLQDPTRRAFTAAGDVNVKSGPTCSCVDPVNEVFVPGAVPCARGRVSQPLRNCWGRRLNGYGKCSGLPYLLQQKHCRSSNAGYNMH
eukprot:1505599-Pyramimonas_sp.AAC.1